MPKLSIVVTTYNVEKYISQTLDSIINQSLKDIEIIIVDDGSTDGTAEILLNYQNADPRITVKYLELNTIGGVASAANAGLDIASGDYIGFADGDDIYYPNMFEVLHRAAADNRTDMAMCGYKLANAASGEKTFPADIDYWKDYTCETVVELDVDARKKLLRFISVPWRKIYKRELIVENNLRFPVGDFFFEDNPFHWASILASKSISMIPLALCEHRIARDGQTMSTTDRRLLQIFKHHQIISDNLKSSGTYRDYEIDLLNWTANQLSWVSLRIASSDHRYLFETMEPIIAEYSDQTIREFGDTRGFGRTFLMIKAVKIRNYKDFEYIISSNDKEDMSDFKSKKSRFTSLIRRGMFHLRYTGVMKTASMVLKYARGKLFYNKDANQYLRGSKSSAINNEDLLAALIVIQSDIKSLRSDIKSKADLK